MEDLQSRFSNFDFEKHKQDLIDDIIFSIGRKELTREPGMKLNSRVDLNYFRNCFYSSFSTFTTVGPGDWYPTGNLNRTIVMTEGTLGWFCPGLFITYANVLLRYNGITDDSCTVLFAPLIACLFRLLQNNYSMSSGE